jgi:hypothetical protein
MNNLTDVLVEVQSLSDIKILLEMDGPLEDGEIEAELFFMMNHFQVGQVNPGLESLGLWVDDQYASNIISEITSLYEYKPKGI